MNLYPITSLFFYKIIFMGWVLFGEGMFLFRLEKKTHFLWRTALSYFLCLGFSAAFPIPTGNAFYQMFMFFMMFIMTYLMALFRYKANWRIVFFSTLCGYTTEHIAYETYYAIAAFSGILINGGGLYANDSLSLFNGPLDQFVYLVSYFVIYWLIFICFANHIKSVEGMDVSNNWSALFVGAFFVIIDIVINSAVSFYSTIHFDSVFIGFVATINIISCIAALLFIFEMSYRESLKKNLEIVEELRKEEKNQYQISKETIDLINIKCHDLKHQIRELGAQEQIRPQTIENISNLINIYDSSIKTQNPVLDVILTEKSLFCSKQEIKFSCIADGSQLSFMSEEDIYSLFGNIIDNAIEAVKDLDKEQRIITLRILSTGNLISISEKNPYQGTLQFSGGLPLTSKADPRYHGFGLKSVKMVCDKYKGSLSVSAEKSTFSVSILFTREEKKA
jgi:hypothetical protein